MADQSKRQRKRRGRGEGGVFQRGDGLWVADLNAGHDSKGKRRRKRVYGKTKAEALGKLQIERIKSPVIVAETDKMTVGQWLDRWQAIRKGTVATNTYHRDEHLVEKKIKPHIGHIPLAKFTSLHVIELYDRMAAAGDSIDSRRKAGTCLGTSMRSAVELRLISFNPTKGVRKPVQLVEEAEVFTQQQVDQLLETLGGDRLEALYVTAVTTGLRQGELFALRWKDVDLAGASLQVCQSLAEHNGKLEVKQPKTAASRRRIALARRTVEVLIEHRKKMLAEGHIDSPVFCAPEGGYLLKGNFYRRSFWPLLKKAELPHIGFHVLRHTHASMLFAAKVDVKTISARLGHSKVSTTLNIYTHLIRSAEDAAVSALDRAFG
jgi:integrase